MEGEEKVEIYIVGSSESEWCEQGKNQDD
jgi:hypothetical protein